MTPEAKATISCGVNPARCCLSEGSQTRLYISIAATCTLPRNSGSLARAGLSASSLAKPIRPRPNTVPRTSPAMSLCRPIGERIVSVGPISRLPRRDETVTPSSSSPFNAGNKVIVFVRFLLKLSGKTFFLMPYTL